METLGVYVQIPFCASKCSFCNFSSIVARAEVLEGFCQALEQEIDRLPALYQAADVGHGLLGFPVDTLYFGGGTPPILGIERLERILRTARRRLQFEDSLEFTLETTPGSTDENFLKQVPALGVNRLSIGAQSFNDRELRAVGRLHTAAETRNLFEQARRAGFDNMSLDLIAGLPFQNEASWRKSLHSVGDLKPEHVSVYIFEVDKKSRLGSEVLRHGTRYHAYAVPDEDFMAEAYETARQFLKAQGYIQYEISNFALPGYESRHNQKYWRLKPYVGLGAGAHSFDGVRRWANVPEAEMYAAKIAHRESPIVEARALSAEEQLEEFFFVGLRQSQGVDLSVANRRWGTGLLSRLEPAIAALTQEGLLEPSPCGIRLTDRAYLVSNEVFREFLLSRQES